VVIWGRREDRNEAAAESLRAHGVRVETDVIDVADEAAQLLGFARALDKMGRLDGVIANAGFVTISPLVDMTLKQYDELQRVAQYGAFITLREGARHMVERAKAGERGGSLIATGSLTNFTATLTSLDGFNNFATLSCVAPLPAGITCGFGPSNSPSLNVIPTALGANTNVRLTVANGVAPNNYHVTIRAASGALVRTQQVSVNVIP